MEEEERQRKIAVGVWTEGQIRWPLVGGNKVQMWCRFWPSVPDLRAFPECEIETGWN